MFRRPSRKSLLAKIARIEKALDDLENCPCGHMENAPDPHDKLLKNVARDLRHMMDDGRPLSWS
jgi:hypothetical protein